MENIKFSVNMETWRDGDIRTVEITKDQFDKCDGYVSETDKVAIFGASAVYGYGVYGYEFYEEDGKYYARFRTGDSCD